MLPGTSRGRIRRGMSVLSPASGGGRRRWIGYGGNHSVKLRWFTMWLPIENQGIDNGSLFPALVREGGCFFEDLAHVGYADLFV